MAVKEWGTGKPDYYVLTISSRPVIVEEGDTQVKMLTHKRYTIAAGGAVIDDFYTVPAGYKLSIGGGFVSVKDSCINQLRIFNDDISLLGDYRFDMRGDLSMTSLAGQEILTGTVLEVYLFNNDAIESEFSLVISGVLNKE